VPKKTKGGGNNNINNGEENNAVSGDDDCNHKISSEVAINVAMTNDATQKQKKEKTTTMPMMLRHNIAINLCLTGLWFCKYQVF
jgi:hypothetical protein